MNGRTQKAATYLGGFPFLDQFPGVADLLGHSGRMTSDSEKGGLWCSRSNWLAARTPNHAIHPDA